MVCWKEPSPGKTIALEDGRRDGCIQVRRCLGPRNPGQRARQRCWCLLRMCILGGVHWAGQSGATCASSRMHSNVKSACLPRAANDLGQRDCQIRDIAFWSSRNWEDPPCKALFSFASKLASVIIFVDEVDNLLGARDGAFEPEATRRMRNEFMAVWDGLRTKDSQRILILGATNRPFDLDDAVIRRLPRRIYVDLADAENRMKILKIFLAQENLDPKFRYDELAHSTEGYSGSDPKNLCIVAAYRPVQELLRAHDLSSRWGKATDPILKEVRRVDESQDKKDWRRNASDLLLHLLRSSVIFFFFFEIHGRFLPPEKMDSGVTGGRVPVSGGRPSGSAPVGLGQRITCWLRASLHWAARPLLRLMCLGQRVMGQRACCRADVPQLSLHWEAF